MLSRVEHTVVSSREQVTTDVWDPQAVDSAKNAAMKRQRINIPPDKDHDKRPEQKVQVARCFFRITSLRLRQNDTTDNLDGG